VRDLTPKKIVDRLAEDATLKRCVWQGREREERIKRGYMRPGQLIEKLPEDQRKILQSLKAEDLQDTNLRWNFEYWYKQ
jgi:hypothetical protein